MEPSHYVGLDVSQELTSICVVDEQGVVVWRGKCTTDPLWCANRLSVVVGPLGGLSANPGGDRHAETCHPVEHVAPKFRLGALIAQNPCVKPSTDDGFVAKHCGFNQTPVIIARTSLPAHASAHCNGRQMFAALRGRCLTRNGCNSWWNNDRRLWVTFGNGVVDLAIVRPICRH
jgi:hypothetical protein